MNSEQNRQISNELLSLLREYLGALAGEAGLAENTLEAYERDLRAAAGFLMDSGKSEWADLSSEDVTDILADSRQKGHAPPTQARLLSSLRGIFRYLRAEGLYQGPDPTRFAGKMHLWKRLPEVLSPTEALRLMDAPDSSTWKGLRDRALLALLYGGGLRVSEAVGLVVQDITRAKMGEKTGFLRICGKGGKERLIPFAGQAEKRLFTWIDNERESRKPKDPQALLSQNGLKLDRGRAWVLVREYAALADLPAIHPHTLRHSCATHLLAGGGDLRSVQEFLGHSDLRTTERYTHLQTDELQAFHKLHHPRG